MFAHLSYKKDPQVKNYKHDMSCYALNPLKYRPTPEQITQTRAWYYSEKERTTPMQPQAETLQNDTIEEFERVLRSNSMTLRYDRSIIHQWGVITTRKHKLGDPLIEYVGELIRLSVVEKDKKYMNAKVTMDHIFSVSLMMFLLMPLGLEGKRALSTIVVIQIAKQFLKNFLERNT